ncbi:MAG: DUF6152 family protein [Rhodospirillaceae bacterium]|nr:DUF6152 family protein [Rhodospirillaceae bacterium]MDD9996769.1 DUF6152 family protein [Rhodospirillaceae bacterium]MDE0361242.1 DUF6152 family protein [Rhodospirillaceae bacterium]
MHDIGPDRRLIAALALASMTAAAVTAYAHHGSAPHFDPEDPVTVEGTVSELRFVNPHSFLHFDVIGADGETVEWRCEMGGATNLGRLGWTSETLTAGQPVTVTGPRARREANSCAVRSIVLADGTEIGGGAQFEGTETRATVADAQDTARRPMYLANGQPNLSGPWILRAGGGMGGGFPEHTEAGRIAAEAYDGRYDNPVIRCQSGNIILDWTRQSHVNDIHQDENRITIRYGYLDLVRSIHLDVSSHPETLTPGIAGHSIGSWEDDVLVVDTVGFMARVLIPRIPVMTSEQMHVVERFAYDEETRTLTRDYVVTDPLYLSEPLRGRDVSDIAAEPYRPFNCVDLSGENNRRPTE